MTQPTKDTDPLKHPDYGNLRDQNNFAQIQIRKEVLISALEQAPEGSARAQRYPAEITALQGYIDRAKAYHGSRSTVADAAAQGLTSLPAAQEQQSRDRRAPTAAPQASPTRSRSR